MSRIRIILLVLLITFIPSVYSQNSIEESQMQHEAKTKDFQDLMKGKKTYSTKGHSKAKGANVSIGYPNTWNAEEADRPNIVQKFVSREGDLAMIIVKDLPMEMPEDAKRELYNAEELKDMIPPNYEFVSAQSTTVDGELAGMIEFSMKTSRVGKIVAARGLLYVFTPGKQMIQVMFMTGSSLGSTYEADARYKALKPLFIQMANSVVLPDKWTKPPEEAKKDESRNATAIFPYTPFELFINFIFTWVLGLFPALFTRYIFARRPLSIKVANWISGITCLVMFMIASALGSKSHAALVLVFYASRKILTANKSQSSNKDINSEPVTFTKKTSNNSFIYSFKSTFSSKPKLLALTVILLFIVGAIFIPKKKTISRSFKNITLGEPLKDIVARDSSFKASNSEFEEVLEKRSIDEERPATIYSMINLPKRKPLVQVIGDSSDMEAARAKEIHVYMINYNKIGITKEELYAELLEKWGKPDHAYSANDVQEYFWSNKTEGIEGELTFDSVDFGQRMKIILKNSAERLNPVKKNGAKEVLE